MKLFVLLFLILTINSSFATKPIYNSNFIGKWEGTAPTKKICSGAKEKIKLQLIKPEMKPGQNYKVILVADWGCFSEMKIPGFFFADEFWGASEDRMTFVKLKLVNPESMSGEFRFDLDGHTLAMDFSDLKMSN